VYRVQRQVRGENVKITASELIMLQKTYLDIKLLAANLVEFEERHTFAKAMKDSLDHCIAELDNVAHEICCDAFKIKMENLKDGKTKTDTD